MFNTQFLNTIREYELNYFINNLDKSSKILEVGGGTGVQAKILSETGYKIESIDIEGSNYYQERVY
ncbi:MAG: hypothetical protein HQL46_16830, partial [Gammaproteobacteria bacterium]|nr:hypothetical protein [Gammaproteobacteria bacterium]